MKLPACPTVRLRLDSGTGSCSRRIASDWYPPFGCHRRASWGRPNTVGESHLRRPLECGAVRAHRRPIHHGITRTAVPACVAAAAMSEAGDMPDEDLIRAEWMPVRASARRLGNPLAVRCLHQITQHGYQVILGCRFCMTEYSAEVMPRRSHELDVPPVRRAGVRGRRVSGCCTAPPRCNKANAKYIADRYISGA